LPYPNYDIELNAVRSERQVEQQGEARAIAG
jgi:hypothetical protein